jgi:hypothetical protein
MATTEVTVSGHVYMVGKLTPKQQLHLARRLLPLFVGVAPAIEMSTPQQGQHPATEHQGQRSAADLVNNQDVDFKNLSKGLGPFAESLAKMSDVEVDAIVDPCLGVTKRKQGQHWAPVMAQGQLMFHDLGISEMMQLVWAVIVENIGNFLAVPTGNVR